MVKLSLFLRLFVALAALFILNSFQIKTAEKEIKGRVAGVTLTETTKAICVLMPTSGSNVHGTVTFTQSDSGVVVVVDINGLTPGKHGFHIHEFGDCSAPDGTSAGGHYNPEGKMHGDPMSGMRHEGDLGNIIANEKGIAKMRYIDSHLKLSGNNSIIGRSVVVHEKEDDMKTQPTGNSGTRIACGVIGIMKA